MAALVCAVYAPALHGGFIFDDATLIRHNPRVNSPDGLKSIWFSTEENEYYPISYSSYWMEWRLWGKNTTGYHVVNVALHVAAALLLWAALRGLSIPGAYLAALLFAVHPVNVESVAWISQRRNVLAMVFFLLSMLWYLRQEDERSRKGENEIHGGFGIWYWLSLLAFLSAMLSKGSVAVEPIVLLLAVWWRRRRIGVGDLARIAPFLVVAVALTAVNIWFQTHGMEVVVRDASFAERAAGAGAVVWFYLSKAVLPIHLLFIYPQWHIQVSELKWWMPLLAALVTTAALAWKGFSTDAKPNRALLFAWGFFCVALAPVLGLTDIGSMQYSLVADHYQHIAIIGIVALVAAGWANWRDGLLGTNRIAANLVALVLVGVLTFLAFEQSRLYGDPIQLYEATLRHNPDCWAAHNNLGIQLDEAGRPQEAKQHFKQALQLKPDYAYAHYNLGNNLAKTGNHTAAIECYQAALRIMPGYIEARNNLGIELSREGRTKEAIECFQESGKIRPDWPDTYFNLGNVYSEINRPEQAAEQYRQALKLKADFAEAWANLAAAYGDLNRWDEAMAAANNALKFARSQGLTEVAAGIEAWRAANATKRPQP